MYIKILCILFVLVVIFIIISRWYQSFTLGGSVFSKSKKLNLGNVLIIDDSDDKNNPNCNNNIIALTDSYAIRFLTNSLLRSITFAKKDVAFGDYDASTQSCSRNYHQASVFELPEYDTMMVGKLNKSFITHNRSFDDSKTIYDPVTDRTLVKAMPSHKKYNRVIFYGDRTSAGRFIEEVKPTDVSTILLLGEGDRSKDMFLNAGFKINSI